MEIEDTSKAESLLINPFYAVIFASYLFNEQPGTAKEDWILLNVHLIDEIGSKAWLEELLDAVTLSTAKYDGHDIINPSLVVKISPILSGDHVALVTREQWIQANAKLMEEIGAANWLEQLLDVLGSGELKDK